MLLRCAGAGFLHSLLAATSLSAATTALEARKRDSAFSVQGLEDGTGPAATLTVAQVSFVPDSFAQWLHELKSMTKNIAISHNGAGSCWGRRQFDLQFDRFPHMQFDRENRGHAGFTDFQTPTRHQPTL